MADMQGPLELGLIVLGVVAVLSALSTVFLTAFICHRASNWHRYYTKDIKQNPFVILLCNLFLADFFQAVGFIFSWHWYGIKSIASGTPACGAQGFLINLGDVCSAFFVMAIAINTWCHLRFQKQLRHDAFVAVVIAIWVFGLVITILGPVTSSDYFVNTGAWCWVHERYVSQRLAYHYFWIFLVQFGLIVVYGFVIWELRRSSRRLHSQNEVPFSQAAETHRRIRKSCLVMCSYPVAYIALTLPLAISRMIEAEVKSNTDEGIAFRIFCGSFLVSSGWVDTLLYVLTRASFLKSQGQVQEHDDPERPSSMMDRISPTPLPKLPGRSMQMSPTRSMASRTSSTAHHGPTRNKSISSASWTTNWSDTKTLPTRPHAEEPLSTFDHDLLVQTSRTLTLDAKIQPH